MRLRKFMLINELIVNLVPILLISIVVFNIMNEYLRSEVTKKNDMIAHTMATHIADLQTDPLHILEQIRDTHRMGILNTKEEMDGYLAAIIHHGQLFESIEVIDKQGKVLHVAPFSQEIIGIQRSGHDFYKEIGNGKEIYWSASFISLQTGHSTVVVAIPMDEKILVGYLNLEYISEISNQFQEQYGKDTIITITDEMGKFISHYDLEYVSQRQTFEQFNLIKNTDVTTGISQHLVDHTERLVSFEKLENPNWYIFVSQSHESAFGTIYKIMRSFLITALLAIGLGIFFSRYKTDYIMQSFEKMHKQADEIAAGDYNTVMSYGNFQEFNKLADHFNEMVNNIRERDEKFKKMAYLDSLTGLANRTYFREFLASLTQGQSAGEKSAILFLDLDNFKWINDTYGHSFGDQVLKAVSQKLVKCMKQENFIARLGGDEFVLILVNVKNEEEVCEFLEHLMSEFRQPILVNSYTLHSQMSIGIAMYPDDSDNADELLTFADTAMYYAKEHGKNNYQFYNTSMIAVLQRKVQIEKALRTALENQEFQLYYQPLIQLKTGRIRGFEALIRWNSRELGFVSPLDFIGIAEETGQIVPIGRWVLETACHKAAELRKLYGTNFIISVNVSALQLRNKDFVDYVQKAMEGSGIGPGELEIEITESVFIDSYEEVVEILGRVLALGIQISLDDFGTGYSSLSYLRKLPIDTVKIDKSFITDVIYSVRSKSLLESIILLAQKMQLAVVAEGIEDQKQLEQLIKYNCDYVQGYFFSKPMPSREVNQYYESYLQKNSCS